MKRKHEKSTTVENTKENTMKKSIYSEDYWKEIDAFKLKEEIISERSFNRQNRIKAEPEPLEDDFTLDELVHPKCVRLKQNATVNTLGRIPLKINAVLIDEYVNQNVTAQMPAHIDTVYVKPGANLTAISSLPATVKNIKYHGKHDLLALRGEHQDKTDIWASKENIEVWQSRSVILPANIKAEEVKKLPLHVTYVGLRKGISPEAVSSLHSCVNNVGIEKGVDPNALKALPNTVKGVVIHRDVSKKQVSVLGPNVKAAVLASPGIPGETTRELRNKNIPYYHTAPSYKDLLNRRGIFAPDKQSDKENTPPNNNNSSTPFKR